MVLRLRPLFNCSTTISTGPLFAGLTKVPVAEINSRPSLSASIARVAMAMMNPPLVMPRMSHPSGIVPFHRPGPPQTALASAKVIPGPPLARTSRLR